MYNPYCYVDDIIISGSDGAGIKDTNDWLHSNLHIKDLGRLHYFLGITVSRHLDGIFMTQHKYILDLLEESKCQLLKEVDTPLETSLKLEPQAGDKLWDQGKYRCIVGKLIYLTVTRPDISFAVSIVSQFMQDPRTTHWQAVMRLLRYLKGTSTRGLLYRKHKNALDVNCFVDYDWAGSVYDKRPTSGFCITLGGNIVIWKSKKQSVVARSSAEAE